MMKKAISLNFEDVNISSKPSGQTLRITVLLLLRRHHYHKIYYLYLHHYHLTLTMELTVGGWKGRDILLCRRHLFTIVFPMEPTVVGWKGRDSENKQREKCLGVRTLHQFNTPKDILLHLLRRHHYLSLQALSLKQQ